MRIVFFGTPLFAASILESLLDAQVDVCAVITQPDRPKGRSLQLAPSAVKQFLAARDPQIPIYQPEKASEIGFLESLKNLKADLYVVVAFGQILPQKLLDIPPKGCINVHASLLPKLRGAAPIQRSLMQGDFETGVTIQKMVLQLDAGDVIATAKIEVPINWTYGELESALCELSKDLLLLVIRSYETGVPSGASQDPTLVTYAAKIAPEDGELKWEKRAADLHNLIRAISPKPGAWCYVTKGDERKRVKILRSAISIGSGASGEILSPEGIVACGHGALQILEIQPEGKKPMAMKDFLRGFSSPPRFS